MNTFLTPSAIRKCMVAMSGILLAFTLSVVVAQDEGTPLSEEMAMTFAEQFDAIFDGPSLEIADAIFSPDFVAHLPLAPELDREGWKNYVASFYTGISDLTEEVTKVVVGHDRVVLNVTYTGTHDGPLFGVPATGKSVIMQGIGIFSFDENGLATENWAVVDVIGLMAQIGAFPPPAAAAQANPLPAPTGAYDVGVVWRHWVDEARDEPYDEATDAKREVIVEILYPAEAAEGAETAPYMDNREAVLPAFDALMQAFVAVPIETQPSDLDHFKSHAYPNAPLAGDQASYPILIFSHGGAADARMYTAQLEELASQGYIVVAINHVYGAAVTVLNNGNVAVPTYSTGLDGAIQIWSQDQIFVMDQLEALNADDPDGLLTNHLDVDRIGVFGQSMGGAASTITCLIDARCKAGANGDGPVIGDVIEQGLDQPFMLLLSDSRMDYDPANYAQVRGPYYEVEAEGFEHLNFGDFALWPNVQLLIDAKWLSNADGARSVEVTNAALVAFFDKYLKAADGTLEEALSAYPEITVTSRNVTASTEGVMGHHLQALMAGDLDAIMSDYAEDAVLFTPNGVFRGSAEIEGFFTQALTIFTPEVLGTLEMARQDMDGEYVYLLWSAGETVPFATDSFRIQDGKIVMQSFAAQFGE